MCVLFKFRYRGLKGEIGDPYVLLSGRDERGREAKYTKETFKLI